MSKVTYTGSSDFQIFDASDFKKADVEGKKITFAKGVPTEVSDEVAKALTSDKGIFGGYSFELAEEAEAQEEPDTADDLDDLTDLGEEALPTSGKTATTEGTTSPDVASAPKSTGKGSSTKSR